MLRQCRGETLVRFLPVPGFLFEPLGRPLVLVFIETAAAVDAEKPNR